MRYRLCSERGQKASSRCWLKQRFLIVTLTGLLVVLGLWLTPRIPLDAVPDVTTNQVQINTEVLSLAPEEIERFVTYPIEVAMSGLPDVEEVRSLSKYGLSQVTVVFKDQVNIYFARQLVLERLQQAKEEIPPGLGTPLLGPIATGLGEIYLYTVEGKDIGSTELRTIQDWIIRPQLRMVPGVAEVNTIGGYEKQYQVIPDPTLLGAHGITLEQLHEALEKNNRNTGGSYVEQREEQYLIRAIGSLQNLQDIEKIVIDRKEGFPIYIRDVAQVVLGHKIRTGAATHNGHECVIGTAMMLKGENSRLVASRVHEKLKEMTPSLPEGVSIETVYDRTLLVNKTIHTVKTNLFEAAILVIAVLLVLLGDLKAGLIVASAIPPPGYLLQWGGQFEHLESARKRLLIVVPLSLFLIFVLLFLTFRSIKHALLVFTGIPFAITGGIFALLLSGMPFSISAAISFIALFGVASTALTLVLLSVLYFWVEKKNQREVDFFQ